MLLELLAETIFISQDSVIHCLLHDVLSWQAVMSLLTGQRSPRVRDAVVGLLVEFLVRGYFSESQLFTAKRR